ncbi:MAG: nickel pincer cofactor biosynthesis protein LarC [Bryobacteraceae bacterium]
MTLCYFDAFSGLAGDMATGALIDAGADSARLIAVLESIGTGAAFRVERTKRKGIAAAKFHVDAPEGDRKHRHLHHITPMIDGSAMSAKAKQTAHAIFVKLAEAEAAVHGTTIEKVHFHEVGAVDSIADICAVSEALDMLGVGRVLCSAVNTGSGTANTEHGILPVPTPATARLLKDAPVYARGPALELTTPTGAAIVAALAESYGPLPAMRVSASGYGAGDRDFTEHANVLRVILGETADAAESTRVCVIETNIDDSTPEVLGYAMEALLAKGALDVTLSPLWMKKNRAATLLRAIVKPEDRESIAAAMFAETSTFGVRIYDAERRVQQRRFEEVDTAHGKVRVKIAANGTFAPEFDDCRKVAESAGVPLKAVMEAAAAAWLARR